MVIEIAPRIVVDSAIHFGKPVISGTRVPVDALIGKLASGMSEDEVAHEYDVTTDDVRAALRYAAGRAMEQASEWWLTICAFHPG